MTNEEIEQAARELVEQVFFPTGFLPQHSTAVIRSVVEFGNRLAAQAYEEAETVARTLQVKCLDCAAHNEHDVCTPTSGEAIGAAIHALKVQLVSESSSV